MTKILGVIAIAVGACAPSPQPLAPVTAPAPRPQCPPPAARPVGPAYVPRVAPAGSPGLPPVPVLPARAERSGDAFTVWGASFALRSRYQSASVTERPIKITGFIVRTNLAEAPRCAVHAGGVADPPGCTAPLPAFWIGDTPDAAISDSIKVVGWASNFAQIYDAIRTYAHPSAPAHFDAFWGMPLPNPLPVAGARVSVRGTYGTTFRRASTGVEMDPVMGLLTADGIDTLEPAPGRAILPGMRP